MNRAKARAPRLTRFRFAVILGVLMRCGRAMTLVAVLAGSGPAFGDWPEVRPPVIEGGRAVRALPERATAVHTAASGRLLIYRLEALRVLAVFDVPELRITGYIPLPEQDDLVAAGRDHVFIADTDSGRIQRWSLQTLEQEYDGTLDGPTPITDIGIGSCATGPLVVISRKDGSAVQLADIALLDPMNLKPLELETELVGSRPNWRGGRLCVSDDGRTCLVGKSGLLGHVQDSVVRFRGIQCTEFHRPGSDGRYCFGRATPLAIDLPVGPGGAPNPLAMSGSPRQNDDSNDVRTTINGVNSPFYLQVIHANERERGSYTVGGIAVTGSKESLMRFEMFPYQITGAPSSMLVHDRLSFLPAAGVVVYVRSHDRELEIVKVDTQSIAEQARYLVFDSPTAMQVAPGEDFAHQLSVVSSFDDLNFVLEYGPKGMSLSSTGELRWKVPREPPAGADALVHVSSGDRDQYHRILFSAPGAAGPASPATPPAGNPEDLVAFVPGGGRFSMTNPMQMERVPFEGAQLRRSLPAPADLVAVAGGGRFLVLHLPSLSKLALFDVNQAAMIGYVPTTGTDTFFAGGGDCIITGEAQSRTLRRWDLKTLRQQNMAVVETEGRLNGMLMGSASTREVIVSTAQHGAEFFNARTLRPIPNACDRDLQFYDPIMERISADGSLLAMAATYRRGGGGGRMELTVFQKNGSSWEARFVPRKRDFIFPIADASFVVDAVNVYSVETGQTVNRAPRMVRCQVPAVHGNLHLTLNSDGLHVNVAGVFPPYVTIDDLPDLELSQSSPRRRVEALDQRIWFIPDADVLAILSPDRDVLTLHRLDVEQKLSDSEDYLVVDEPPVVTARLGQTYQYRISARTKDGEITYEATSGPPEMQLNDAGAVSWSVPPDWSNPAQNVVVTLRNENGLEIQHPWTILFPELLHTQTE